MYVFLRFVLRFDKPTEVAKRFKNAAAGNGYGLTETNGAISINTGDNYKYDS